jgi:hypothetical protein
MGNGVFWRVLEFCKIGQIMTSGNFSRIRVSTWTRSEQLFLIVIFEMGVAEQIERPISRKARNFKLEPELQDLASLNSSNIEIAKDSVLPQSLRAESKSLQQNLILCYICLHNELSFVGSLACFPLHHKVAPSRRLPQSPARSKQSAN